MFKLINFDNIMIGDYDLSKSSKQSVRLLNENSHSDESMILKREDKILIDMDSSKGLIGKSSKDNSNVPNYEEPQMEEAPYFEDVEEEKRDFSFGDLF